MRTKSRSNFRETDADPAQDRQGARAATAAPKITSRIDAITLIPDACRTPAPPRPRSAKIELTQRCNHGCA